MDPKGIQGGNNVYSFVGNDAINNVDVWGMLPYCKCISAHIDEPYWVLQNPNPWWKKNEKKYEALHKPTYNLIAYTYRVGLDIPYVFEIEGDLKCCRFYQREEGYMHWATLGGIDVRRREFDGAPSSITDAILEGGGRMIDMSGINYFRGNLVKIGFENFVLTYNLSIRIDCVGTDGQDVSDSRLIVDQRAFTATPLDVFWMSDWW